jgi:hypothetical protein
MLQVRKVADSILITSFRYLNWPNPPICAIALGSKQSLTEMNTRNLSWGVKCCRRVRLTTSTPSVSRISISLPFTFLVSVFIHYTHKQRMIVDAPWYVPNSLIQWRNPPLQLSLWWSTSHPSQSSRSKPSSAAWQQTPMPVSAYWSAWQILINFCSL